MIHAKASAGPSVLSRTCRQGNTYVAIRRKPTEKSNGGKGSNGKSNDDSINCIFESWNSAKKYLDTTNEEAEYETLRSVEEAVLYAFGKPGSGGQLQCKDQEGMEVDELLEEEPTVRRICKVTILSAFESVPQEI